VTANPQTWPSPDQVTSANQRANVILAIAAVLLTTAVLATLAGVVIVKRGIVFGHQHTPDTLVLAAANAPGDDPFISSVVINSPPVSAAADQQIATTNEQLPTSQERGVRLVSGTHPGLYGDVGIQNPCDAASITNALYSHSDRVQVWAQTQSIQADQIQFYMNTLTPVVMTADTWVTSHRYSRARAVSFQAILQAGSAVMIDPAGVPRVQCASGNPLSPPASENITTLPQSGTSWPGYSAQNVVAIEYTNAPSSFADPVPTSPASQFSLIDLSNGNPLPRKTGGTIDISSAMAGGASLPDPIAMNTPPAK
jgi:hypothetical protein